MMFGSGDKFEYFKCQDCGCLQIAEIPKDLSKHYPPEYYSLHTLDVRPASGLKARLRALRLKMAMSDWANLEPVLGPFLGRQDYFPWLKLLKARPDERVLDVGAGSGSFLRDLHGFGFSDLTGVEPFIPADLHYAPGFSVLKRELKDLSGPYDIITAHHSLEHMPAQLEALRQFHRLLAPGGRLLVRIPVVSSRAWEDYGVDWVQLDAPRHFYLHTTGSLELIAGKAGFRLDKILYDSSDFQFWASRQYQLGIPLRDPRSYAVDRRASPFSRLDILRFRAQARRLNEAGRGDSACFFLAKAR